MSRVKRRKVQVDKYAALMRVRAAEEAERAKVKREAEAARRAEEMARAAAMAKAAALAKAKARAEAQARAKADAMERAKTRAEAQARAKAEAQARSAAKTEAKARRKAEAEARKRARGNISANPQFYSQHGYSQHGNMRYPYNANGDDPNASNKNFGDFWNKELQLALAEHEKQTTELLQTGRFSVPQIEALRETHLSRMRKAAGGLARSGFPPISEEQLRASIVFCERRAGQAVSSGQAGRFQTNASSNEPATHPPSRSPPAIHPGPGIASQTPVKPAWPAPGNTAAMGTTFHQGQSDRMGVANYTPLPAQQSVPGFSPMLNGGRYNSLFFNDTFPQFALSHTLLSGDDVLQCRNDFA